MLTNLTFSDKNIVSRSFRFLSPNVQDPSRIFKNVDYDLETSYFSTAIGDNRYVNPLPGYGFNTDPSPGIVRKDAIKNQYGNLGRYYKRIHDDNVTLLTLVPCTVEFTGILPFLVNMFDYAASTIANKGRAPSWAFYLTETMSAIAFFPFQLIGVGMNFLTFLFDEPKNSWFYLKQSTGMYLAAAQGILNDLMINAGYIITTLNDTRQQQGNQKQNDRDYFIGTLSGYDSKDSHDAKKKNAEFMNSIYPDAINDDGTIDIVKIVGRGARKYRYFLTQLKNLDTKVNSPITPLQREELVNNTLEQLVKNPSFINGTINPTHRLTTNDYLKRELQTTGRMRDQNEISNPEMASAFYNVDVANNVIPTSDEYKMAGSGEGSGVFGDVKEITNKFQYGSSGSDVPPATGSYTASGEQINATTENSEALEGTIPLSFIDVNKDVSQESWLGQIGELLQDAFLGGMESVTFRVEGGTGPVSDSFSNNTRQSDIAGYFNSAITAVNNFKFNVQGGTTGIGPVDYVLNTIKDGVVGLASGSVIGNIPLALLGNARVSVPEHWEDSTANLHTESYTIYSEALYAHPYSISMAVFLPLALIGPFIWPIASGGSTYTTPFMVKAFSRGRTIIKRGIVKNASITFGEGELGWTKDRKPLNIRINLDIADLDPILAMPVTRMKNPLDVVNLTRLTSSYLSDIGKYNDYISRIAGIDYLDTILKYNRLNRVVTRVKTDFQQMFSPSYIAGSINDSIVGQLGTAFSPRPLNR